MSFIKKCVGVVAVVAVAGGGLYLAKPELFTPESLQKYLPKQLCDALGVHKPAPSGFKGNSISSKDWKDPEQAQKKISAKIAKLLPTPSPEKVKAFLKKKSNRLLIAQLTAIEDEMASQTDREKEAESFRKNLEDAKKQLEDSTSKLPPGLSPNERTAAQNKITEQKIAAIEKELATLKDVRDVANSKDPDLQNMLKMVQNNLEWMEQITSTGEASRFGTVISTLAQIAKEHPQMPTNKIQRDIATATAVEFARYGYAQEDAVSRADFFIKNYEAGRLTPSFKTLPFWQRRILCGLKGKGDAFGTWFTNDASGRRESMDWSLDNVHLPADRYPGACWQCSWQDRNIYGESVHNDANFWAAFKDTYGKNQNAFTYNVGGVCGGLSHFGAICAISSGVPALTAAEPGHCSYIVNVDGKWTPSYSLSWERDLHWQVFKDNYKYSQLHMADNLFSDKEKKNTGLSQAQRALANDKASSDPKAALQLLQDAVVSQPINYYAWRDYAKLLASSPEVGTSDTWVKLCKDMDSTLAPLYPEMAAELLKQFVYPNLKKALGDNEELLTATVLDFWKHVKNMGPDEEWDEGNKGRWGVEDLAKAQLSLLGIDLKKDPRIVSYFRDLMNATHEAHAYSPILVTWGSSLLENLDPKLRNDFMATVLSGMGNGDDASMEDAKEKFLKQMITTAEKNGDLSSFQTLGKTLPEKYHKKDAKSKLPSFNPYPGKLVSKGGMVQVDQPHSSWNNPCFHWGLLEPGIGGHFITEKVENPVVTITLPRQANLTGIVLVGTEESQERLNHVKVQVSETGSDNDWKDVISDLGPCKNQLIRAEFPGKPLAKAVRLIRVGGPEHFHLIGIYVYGNPAA